MKALLYIYLGLAVYGFVTGHIGGAIIALIIAGFNVVAEKVMRKQEKEYWASPRSATTDATTDDRLEEECCECWRTHL